VKNSPIMARIPREPEDLIAFVRTQTSIEIAPLCPELRLHLATEYTPIWEATEKTLEERGLAPPFWAFAWAGGQAVARLLLDRPDYVAGKRVLDFAAGCGVAAIAACKAGAQTVQASEIDPFSWAAMTLNARLNNVSFEIQIEDLIGARPALESPEGWDVILVGDMCYERKIAEAMTAWLRALAAMGVLVLLGDPGRNYLPEQGLEEIICYDIPTTLELENATLQKGRVWRLLP